MIVAGTCHRAVTVVLLTIELLCEFVDKIMRNTLRKIDNI